MSASDAKFECESQTAGQPATRNRNFKASAILVSVFACAVLGIGLIAAERYGVVDSSVNKFVGAQSVPGKTLDPTKFALAGYMPTVGSHPTQLRPAASPTAASTARHAVPVANLADRAARLVKSNVNELLNKFEDPEKVLNQAVEDMQRDLVKVRQSYAEVSATQRRMSEQKKAAEAEAARWYSRAQLAIEKGEDDLAKEALTRRQAQQETADGLAGQVETQTALIANLYGSMQDLERKMAEAKASKDQIIARARTAKAATNVNDMLAGIGSGSSMAAFERMSEKVEVLEAKAQVSKELAASSPGGGLLSGSGGGALDAKFKALEGTSSVDDELAAMKRAVALPAAKEVDDELAAMKRAIESEEAKKE